MQPKYNKALNPLARELRKNMTSQERDLWYKYLRHHPLKFTRQKVLGKYIADFYCASAKLVIELDGSQHYEPQNQRTDQIRTEYLETFGVAVLRIANTDVMRNFSGVCEYIDGLIQSRSSE